jgi:prevent-host-death family protein
VRQKELRHDVAGVLRRAEGGERIAVTVSGRPVAQLGPLEPDTWVRGADVADVWRTAAPAGLAEELAERDDELRHVADVVPVRRPVDLAG